MGGERETNWLGVGTTREARVSERKPNNGEISARKNGEKEKSRSENI